MTADTNIRTDCGKLRHPVRTDRRFGVNASVIRRPVAGGGKMTAVTAPSFPAGRMADTENFKSLPFHFGVLSIQGVHRGSTVLGIPDLTVREFTEGEAHVKGFLPACLGLTRGCVILPGHESPKGCADFHMTPDQGRRPAPPLCRGRAGAKDGGGHETSPHPPLVFRRPGAGMLRSGAIGGTRSMRCRVRIRKSLFSLSDLAALRRGRIP